MGQNLISRGDREQRGQTMILVAVSIVSLLAMAALAIDVVTLYVASTEIQRAADAAALAGAKAMADSGLTSLPEADPSFTAVQTLARNMANSAIAAVLAAPNNQVAGFAQAPGTPTFNFTPNSNGAINDPRVTVTLQQTGLPTFFAHIWGAKVASVTASATAEAYNPANMANYTQIAPKGVKPWLVANYDPVSGNPFVNLLTGEVESGAISNADFWLNADCPVGGANSKCTYPPPSNPPGRATIPEGPGVQYLPAVVSANTANVCSKCASGSDYQSSIQCADMNPYQFPQCGAGATNAQWDQVDRINPNGSFFSKRDTTEGVECLIHAQDVGLNQGQDSISWANWPMNPMQITSNNTAVSTSSSIVAMPIIDRTNPIPASGAVSIIGYLQAFIEQIDANNNIQIKVINVVGCVAPSAAATSVLGGNTSSPIPVRLITTP